jgi:hypothetical protein
MRTMSEFASTTQACERSESSWYRKTGAEVLKATEEHKLDMAALRLRVLDCVASFLGEFQWGVLSLGKVHASLPPARLCFKSSEVVNYRLTIGPEIDRLQRGAKSQKKAGSEEDYYCVNNKVQF